MLLNQGKVMRFPSIKDVARELRLINASVESLSFEDECEVRLQIYEDGKWIIRYGCPSYDTDHHGYWGASYIPGVVNGKVVRFNSYEVARDLLSQAREDKSTGWTIYGVRDV